MDNNAILRLAGWGVWSWGRVACRTATWPDYTERCQSSLVGLGKVGVNVLTVSCLSGLCLSFGSTHVVLRSLVPKEIPGWALPPSISGSASRPGAPGSFQQRAHMSHPPPLPPQPEPKDVAHPQKMRRTVKFSVWNCNDGHVIIHVGGVDNGGC